MNMTEKEYALLDAIVHDEYQPTNTATPESFEDLSQVWTRNPCRRFGKSAGGIMSSLVKKGWAEIFEDNSGDGNTCQITETGYQRWETEHLHRGIDMKTKTELAISIIAQLYNMSEEAARERRPEALKRMARRSLPELRDLYQKSEAARISMGKPKSGNHLPTGRPGDLEPHTLSYATLPMNEDEAVTLIRALINYQAWLRDEGRETNEEYHHCDSMLEHLNAL